jgi:hypothetical protein
MLVRLVLLRTALAIEEAFAEHGSADSNEAGSTGDAGNSPGSSADGMPVLN